MAGELLSYICCMTGRVRCVTTAGSVGAPWAWTQPSSSEWWSWPLRREENSSPGPAWFLSLLVTLCQSLSDPRTPCLALDPDLGYLWRRSWMFLASSWIKAFKGNHRLEDRSVSYRCSKLKSVSNCIGVGQEDDVFSWSESELTYFWTK